LTGSNLAVGTSTSVEELFPTIVDGLAPISQSATGEVKAADVLATPDFPTVRASDTHHLEVCTNLTMIITGAVIELE
jgi:hypothetical protein